MLNFGGCKCLSRSKLNLLKIEVSIHMYTRGANPTKRKGKSNMNMLIYFHQEFQVPKMEVLNLIRLFCGWVFPYISLTYSLYRWGFLHFRYLKCLVIFPVMDPCDERYMYLPRFTIKINHSWRKMYHIFWAVPLPRLLVTTRNISCLVGDSYKLAFATISGKGCPPNIYWLFGVQPVQVSHGILLHTYMNAWFLWYM